MENILVNGINYQIVKLLGKGKGGYSYLALKDNKYFVVKQIHHEPCEYYNFGNKIESENNDYKRLLETGIALPKMIDIDFENERIVKEYIDGPTISQLVEEKKDINKYVEQVLEMQKLCKAKNLNIDYYPTNFVVQNEQIYYIDYECNLYDPKWDYDNWGRQYWIIKT